MVASTARKFFVSAVIPGGDPVGIMQIRATTESELKRIAEKLCPRKAHFHAFAIEDWEQDLPIGKFVPAEEAFVLGYKVSRRASS